MPPVASPSKVLVSGVNGYLATWVARTFLENGYSVRGSVRSAHKAKHPEKLFANYRDRFEIVEVADIAKEGAFDDAVQGVDLIVHIASPFTIKINEPDDLLIPSVRGTVGILESAKKYGSNVKRVAIASSCAAIFENHPTPKVFDETMWNEAAIRDVKEQGSKTSPLTAYRASKAMAEKAAWEFYDNTKSSINWDLTTLCPPVIFGPVLQEVPSADKLNLSMLEFFGTVIKGTKDAATMASVGSAWVDVRDLAQAFVLAAEKADAGDQRIIVSGGPYYWQDIVDVANSIEPAPVAQLTKGEFGSTKGKPYLVDYDTTKCKRILGLEFRTLQDCVRDCLLDLKQKDFAQ